MSRRLRALGVSGAAHLLVIAPFLFFVHPMGNRHASQDPSSTDQIAASRLVWLAVPGDGGGGGSGGNRMPDPPRRIQRQGGDALSVPPVAVPVLVPAVKPIVEPPSEQTIAAPVLAQASATLTLPGAIDSTSLTTVSLGPGTSEGAGQHDGGGIGKTPGPGLGNGPDRGAPGRRGDGANLVMPTIVRDVKPRYTAEAMRARVEGAVLLRAIVHTDGSVRDVQVVRSLDPVFGLDQAAMSAARQWLFRPGLMAGLPVPVAVTIELSFNLR